MPGEGCLISYSVMAILDDLKHSFEATENAISTVFCSVNLEDNELDGALVSLENIHRSYISLQPTLPATEYRAFIDALLEMISLLRALQEENVTRLQRSARRRGRPFVGCSARTIRRRIQQYGFESFLQFDAISDSDLDDVVTDFVMHFPAAGQKTLESHLCSKGLRIQRWRIRESMHRVDPWGVQERSRRVLQRRKYSVPGPNSLWHYY